MKTEMDTLAAMVAEGFSSIATRFNELEENRGDRIASLEKEVRLTSQHIDWVVMPMLDSHANRIKNLELKLC